MVFKNFTASDFGRWNELRPMIDPNPPPSRIARTSSKIVFSSLFAPPEKMTMRRPSNELCTICLTRSAKVAVNQQSFSISFGERKIFQHKDVTCELALTETDLEGSQARLSIGCKR